MLASDIEDFEDILDNAELEAYTKWEKTFVADIKSSVAIFSEATIISEAQLFQLKRIAKYED